MIWLCDRSLTVCNTEKWTLLCCQIALWLNTRRQTICAVVLPPSYGLFTAALSVGSLYAHHWSSPILSRVFQLPVMIVHVRISLTHAPELPLWYVLCVIFLSVLNHCEVHRISAVLYQCFSDIVGADSVTIETYKPVLTALGKSIKVSRF